jgi:hypothetical protein
MALGKSFSGTTCLPSGQDQVDDIIHPNSILDLRKNRWSAFPHLACIPFHDSQISPHNLCQIGLVHDQEIRLRNPRASFARNLVATRDVNLTSLA